MARLGRSYVFPQIRRNPQEPPAGSTYDDTVTGTVVLSGTATEAHSKDEGTKSGTIPLTPEISAYGDGTYGDGIYGGWIFRESHVHSAEISTYGGGTFGGGTFGGGLAGTIPLSGAAAESFEPPGGGLLETQRRRRQYGN